MKLQTERLIIRDYEMKDLKDALEYLMNPKTMHYIPEEFLSEGAVREFIEHSENRYYPVVLCSQEKVIGHLYFASSFGNHTYEIGWVFNDDFHGLGYAYEAASALIDYGFTALKLHRVIATCQPENEASWRLMERLGMRKEGFFKRCIPKGETWWDEYSYAILQEEWVKHCD